MGSACRAACSWLGCIIFVALIVLALFYTVAVLPHTIAATVDSASLATFNLSSSSSPALLAYNLTVAVTVRNPNKHAGLYYYDVEVLASYKDQRFGYGQLESFYQGAKTSTQLNPEFYGQQLLQGGVVDAAEFGSQQANGSFAINVELNAKLRVKVLKSKLKGYKANIICELLVPAPGATNGATFVPTDCEASLVGPPVPDPSSSIPNTK